MDYNRSKESADYINQRTSIRPQLGIICGSGQGKTFGSKMQKQYKLFSPALKKRNEMAVNYLLGVLLLKLLIFHQKLL